MHSYSPLGEAKILDYPAEYIVWNGLRQRWPQLNDKTKISITEWREIRIPEGQSLSAVWEDKWQYEGKWTKTVKGWFVRVLAALFNEPAWFNQGGMEIFRQKPRISPVAKISYRTVTLQRFGYQIAAYDRPTMITCGYDIPSDTLFIWRR